MQGAYPIEVKNPSLRRITRQANLKSLIVEAGGAVALSLLAGTPKSYISAMSSGDRGVGDEMAARLESIMGKPAGWMDQPQSANAHSSDALEIADLFDKIKDPDERNRFYTFAHGYARLAIAAELISTLDAAKRGAPDPAPKIELLRDPSKQTAKHLRQKT